MLRRLSSSKNTASNNNNKTTDVEKVATLKLHLEKTIGQFHALEKVFADLLADTASVAQKEVGSGDWFGALLSGAEGLASGVDKTLIAAGGAFLGLSKAYPRLIEKEFAFGAFISHFKIEGGTVAGDLAGLAKKAVESLPPIFLDSNNMERLDLLMLDVYRSNVFAVLLAPHKKVTEEGSSSSEFGLFSRPYCVVEMVAASKSKKPCVGLVIVPTENKDAFVPNQIPKTATEVKALLKEDGWKQVCKTTGSTVEECVEHVLYVAKQCLDKTKVVELRRDDAKEYPKDLMRAFESMKQLLPFVIPPMVKP